MSYNLAAAMRIHGWMSEPELAWLAMQASTRKTIVEVGCWLGRTTRALADNTAGTVYAVDTWEGSDEETHKKFIWDHRDNPNWLFETFAENLKEYLCEPDWHVRPLKDTSVRAASYLGNHYGLKFDMIFIDAGHDYGNVHADLEAWRPHLAPGGLLCGHDARHPGVARALVTVTGWKYGPGNIWYVPTHP